MSEFSFSLGLPTVVGVHTSTGVSLTCFGVPRSRGSPWGPGGRGLRPGHVDVVVDGTSEPPPGSQWKE